MKKKVSVPYHELKLEGFPSTVLIDGKGIRFTLIGRKDYKVNTDKTIEFFDFEKMRGDTTIRPWKNGDRFQPRGMSGSKKLSDFFVSEKMNLFEKEDCRLLINDDRIMWIIGKRADEHFAVTSTTQQILKAELL
jgi:tRNA(Ile)-lysidine synthase